MRARDLMTSPAITVHVNDPLNVAAQRMWDHDCGAVAVVNDEGKLAGMITDRDICMAALMQVRSLDSLLVNLAMAKHVVAAKPDEAIGAVEQLMATHQIRRIPIVDADNKPIGMISLNDLAIESAQPDNRMRQGVVKVANTLAAICRHRTPAQQAA
jgi:CBS domain-containing protein